MSNNKNLKIMAIFNDYEFGKLNAAGEIEDFVPYQGALKVYTTRRGKKVTALVYEPTEAQMNAAGWYRVETIDGVGNPYQDGNVIYKYNGVVILDDDSESDGSEENDGAGTETETE